MVTKIISRASPWSRSSAFMRLTHRWTPSPSWFPKTYSQRRGKRHKQLFMAFRVSSNHFQWSKRYCTYSLLEREHDRHAISFASTKRPSYSKSTSYRCLDNEDSETWSAITLRVASSGFSTVLHHRGKILITCSIQSLGPSRWYGNMVPKVLQF